MSHITKIGLIVIRDRSILLNRKRGSKFFLLPGGKPERGETEQECLCREIMEEHGVGLLGNRRYGEFFGVAANEKETTLTVIAYLGEIDGMPTPGGEIEEQIWWKRGDKKDILSPLLRDAIIPRLIKERRL